MTSAHPVPGSAVAPRTALRVVAKCETDPVIIGLNSERIHTLRYDNSADTHTSNFDTHDGQHDPAVYEDYIHAPTGRHVMIPVRVDPVTGQRTRFCEPPNGFMLNSTFNDEQPAPASFSILENFMNIFRCTAPPDTQANDLAALQPAPVTPLAPMRQPIFDEPEDPDSTTQHGIFKLSTKALKTQLELNKISAFIVEFRPLFHVLIQRLDAA